MVTVIGGTGVTGSQVVAALKAKGARFKCVVRNPDAARAMLGAGVELVQGDLADKPTLKAAFAGTDAVYLVCGHSPNLAQLEQNALEAARDAGVGYFVLASGTEKGISADSPSEIMRMHHRMENALKETGMRWAISRPNVYMSILLAMAPTIKQTGKLVSALPADTKLTMIHPADVGECGAELLTGTGHDGNTYFLTGRTVSMGDVAKEISRALGKEIGYVQVTPEAARQALVDRGAPDWQIAHQRGVMGLAAKGLMAGSTDWVERLTGHPPRTLVEWVNANKGAFA